VQASPEQVIIANPDTIVTWDPVFYDRVWTDPLWADIEAVRRRRVYLSPTAPFGWIDRPPSVNRMIGLKWLAGLFYPDRWEADLPEEARDFYSLWYGVHLSEAELDRLLEWAKGRTP
jgi:iron complex transport system substrate-binding protein